MGLHETKRLLHCKENGHQTEETNFSLIPAILATQEDPGSRPIWANSSKDPISKKPITKKG
jgi:hypothetical protein